jgi:quinol monooxygenase YgiN
MVFKVASYRVPAAAKDKFSKTVQKLIGKAKGSPGVVGYRGGFDLHDGEMFILTGLYESEAAFEKHLASDHLKSAVKDVAGMYGVKFVSAGSFEATEEKNNRDAHVQQLLR